MKFPRVQLIALFLVFFSLSSQALTLSEFLQVDRFQYYLGRYSSVLQKRGFVEEAKYLQNLKPEEIAKLDFERFQSTQQFDSFVVDLLDQKFNSKHSAQDLAWNDNFFKRKLQEAYLITPEKAANSPSQNSPLRVPTIPFQSVVPPSLGSIEEVTLDANEYISSRTTRAIFWESEQNGTPLEFHLGSNRDFLNRVHARNGKLLSLVRPFNRNYNPIYLVQYPEDSFPTLAVSAIGGQDRLNHWLAEVDLVHWEKSTNSQTRQNKVKVFGSLDQLRIDQETQLLGQLSHLPKADYVVLGQKSGIEKMFRYAAKAKLIIEAFAKDETQFRTRLLPSEIKLLQKIAVGSRYFDAYKNSSDWDKIIEKIHSSLSLDQRSGLESGGTFGQENGTHEFSDLPYTDSSGNPKLLRVFSNVWGDEISPIINALVKSGHHRFSYIGTAGAFPGKGIKVGDLISPKEVVLENGSVVQLSPKSSSTSHFKNLGRVTHVSSPFQENATWLKNQIVSSDLVEVETSYLIPAINPQQDQLNLFLMISDVINSADETLSASTSSSRKGAFFDALAEVATLADLRDVAQRSAIQSGSPSKPNVLYSYFVKQSGNASSAVFSDEFAVRKLESAGSALFEIVSSSARLTKIPQIYENSGISNGRWNPKTDSIHLFVVADTAEEALQLETAKNTYFTQHPQAKKDVILEVVRSAAGTPWTQVFLPSPESLTIDILVEAYAKSALTQGGVFYGLTSTGKYKFQNIPQASFDCDRALSGT